MTSLQEIDHKLSLLPEYLRYRADTIVLYHTLSMDYNESTSLFSFDEWILFKDKQFKREFPFRSEFMSPGFNYIRDPMIVINPNYNG